MTPNYDIEYGKWCNQHSTAAQREGWDIFECFGTSFGRWQVQALDDGVGPSDSAKLDDDGQAWAAVLQGQKPHHAAARAFICRANPGEFRMWADLAGKLSAAGKPLDLSGLTDDERLELLTAVLS